MIKPDPANRIRRLRAFGAAIVLSILASAPAASAQDAPDQPGRQAEFVRDEVELRVVKLGPGGRTRAGSWSGVLVEFKDSAIEQREILLRIVGHDRDGDPPYFERVVVGDPERARTTWLYARLPYPEAADRVAVTAHEALESSEAAGAGELGFRPGRVLGRTWLETTRLVQPESGLIGVVGSRDFGLRRYGTTIQAEARWLPLGHEHTEVVTGLTMDDLPDRWQGLEPFEVLVWGRAGADTDPSALGPERARALMSWVRRGGHLVVVLPPVGQEWIVPARNPLSEILPAMRVERRENVSLEAYRPMLTLDRSAPLPRDSVVHVLSRTPGAGLIEAMPILSGPDGGCVVMRRLVGSGMVTVVGLDLASGTLAATGVLNAEAFWHRVLGRRHSLESYDEIRAHDIDLASAIQQRVNADYDADIEQQIDRKGDSSAGVLLSLAVFILYWLLAGPVGFALLGKSGRRAFAWVGFLGMIGVFTAFAWLGATALRPKKVEGTHLAFIDEVHGTGTQRSRVWMSVLVPSYGDSTIAVGSADDAGDDLLTAWAPPPPTGRGTGFPDNRGYRVSARRPNSMTVPVRSTIKQVRADWTGDRRWGLPRPIGQPGDEHPPALRLVDPDAGVVEGELVHDLPGPIQDVLVVVVAGQRALSIGGRGPTWMPARSFMDKPTQYEWHPGERLNLRAVTGSGQRTPLERSSLNWFNDAAGLGVARSFTADRVGREADPPARLTAISFAQMLGAPDFKAFRSRGRVAPIVTRRETHGLDLSRWFTQPCVIVIGQFVQEGGAPPAPLTVDGEPFPSRGRTVVRWVYPLEPAVPSYVGVGD